MLPKKTALVHPNPLLPSRHNSCENSTTYHMRSFQHFTEARDSSNKLKGMTDLVIALKAVLDQYDLPTRRLIWKRLTSAKGHELVEKLMRNPRTYLSMSEFRKLVD